MKFKQYIIAWWRLSQVPFLSVGLLPLILGFVLAWRRGYHGPPGLYLLSILVTLLIMWMTYYLGERNDLEGDRINESFNPYSGGSRVLVRRAPWPTRALHAIAGRAVLRNVRRLIGLDRARYLRSDAAPISPDLLRFYHALGLDMREVYGETECCGPTTVHYPGDMRFGTVGRALPRAEVRIAEDGEILVRGPHVFASYYRDPEKTAEALADGWLHTGDVGAMDDDGHVRILDREKDIIITSGGKNITPSEIENQLKFAVRS